MVAMTDRPTRELVFLGPGLRRPESRGGTRYVQLPGTLFDLSLSQDPDHATVTEHLTELFAQGREITLALAPQVRALVGPEDSFWAEYWPHFVYQAVGPFLANALIARAAIEGSRPDRVRVRENMRRPGWLKGREALSDPVQSVVPPATRLMLPPGWSVIAPLRRAAGYGVARARTFWHSRQYRQEAVGSQADAGARRVDVLFAPTVGSHAPFAACLTKGLTGSHGLATGVVNCVSWASTAAALQRHGLAYWPWGRFLTAGDLAAAREAVRRGPALATAVPELELPGSLPENMALALRDVLRERLRVALAADWPLHLLRRTAARRMLDAVQPRTVVGFDLYHSVHLAPLLCVAKERGLPTVLVQHGAFGGPPNPIMGSLDYTHALLFGGATLERIRGLFPPETRFTIAGQCLYDWVAGPPEAVAARPAAAVERPVILVADQDRPLPRDRTGWWIGEVCRAAEELGAVVWVKLHPMDKRAKAWRRALQPWPHARVVVDGEARLLDLIRRSAVVLTEWSSVVLEAGLVGRPVITVNLTGLKDPYPFAAEGGALGVYRLQDIQPALGAVLRGETGVPPETSRRFLVRHAGPLDGQATARMCEVLAGYAQPAG
jgi:hypothetical protein